MVEQLLPVLGPDGPGVVVAEHFQHLRVSLRRALECLAADTVVVVVVGSVFAATAVLLLVYVLLTSFSP